MKQEESALDKILRWTFYFIKITGVILILFVILVIVSFMVYTKMHS